MSRAILPRYTSRAPRLLLQLPEQAFASLLQLRDIVPTEQVTVHDVPEAELQVSAIAACEPAKHNREMASDAACLLVHSIGILETPLAGMVLLVK